MGSQRENRKVHYTAMSWSLRSEFGTTRIPGYFVSRNGPCTGLHLPSQLLGSDFTLTGISKLNFVCPDIGKRLVKGLERSSYKNEE